ncbi:hypothetical protein SAMN05444166_0205 [Singulisphaera sp. GP187]|uniref:TubC N-terminal docking domain-related protein n=1 Tax=Singulisphaera sp. GP187 TaxID=1882752 RepID=UPI000929F46F|nr:hypothetical protein [Singulisphaera sp. GP187]SIN69775.1 hypothetical protein SAMN05444166_0205 [Singulisphaera sp. GP187]
MTSAATTLAEARRRGVNLAESAGRLAVDSPREAFTPDLREALIAHKVEILGLLKSEATSPAEHSTSSLGATHSWPPRPKQLASWSLEKRELWGRRANQLEDEGLDWRAAEQQAYCEVAEAHGEPQPLETRR